MRTLRNAHLLRGQLRVAVRGFRDEYFTPCMRTTARTSGKIDYDGCMITALRGARRAVRAGQRASPLRRLRGSSFPSRDRESSQRRFQPSVRGTLRTPCAVRRRGRSGTRSRSCASRVQGPSSPAGGEVLLCGLVSAINAAYPASARSGVLNALMSRRRRERRHEASNGGSRRERPYPGSFRPGSLELVR